MRANELKGRLLTKDYTLRRVASELSLSHALVSGVVNGKQRSLTVETKIAEILGVDLEVAFPHRAPAVT